MRSTSSSGTGSGLSRRMARLVCIEDLDTTADAGDLARQRPVAVAPQLHLDAAVLAGGADLHPGAEQHAQETHHLGLGEGAGPRRCTPLLDLVDDEAPRLGEL